MEFDYTGYSWASVKLFLDCLHLIPAGPTDIITLIECIDLAQFEGKTTYDSFEVELVERLLDSVLTTKLPLSSEILVSIFLGQVDNMTDNRYQQKVAKRMAEKNPSFLFFASFDMESEMNKQLIAMCVKKRLFADASKKAVLAKIITYGKQLYDFAVENLEFDDGFRPDGRSVRYGI